ncbi:RDD family protein [Pengzhenrongella phosphoraccumulans]|uniref:RDD family protein n=1 Tax=Pengzhenrongella phosphoraccumulans TaxID=3114394 RepID=UPI00388FD193
MSTTGTPCAACGSDLVPGAPFCAACGASARGTASLPMAPRVPELGEAPPIEAAVVPAPRMPAPVVPVPVTVPVTPLPLSAPELRRAPTPAPQRAASSAGLGDPVPAIAPRLLALLVDQAVAGVAAGLVLLVMSLLAGSATSAGAGDAVTISLLMSTFLLPALVATAVQVGQWTWEGRTGKTVGNLLLHLRTVSAATGRAAGFWPIVVRQLLQGLGALVCYVGAYVVAASGAWDSGPRRQGWHDKVAGTVVVSAPRAAPMDRAGAASSAAPAPPMPWGSDPQFSPDRLPATALPATALPATTPLRAAAPLPATAPLSTPPGIISAVPGFAAHPVVAPPAPAVRPVVVLAPAPFVTEPPLVPLPAVRVREAAPARDSVSAPSIPAPAVPAPDDVDETRLSSGAPSEAARFDLVFDTGEVVHVAGDGVVGRNPAPAPGESVTHRVCIPDRERSVSKTHLGFGLDVGGLWVADLGSTNGSVLIDADGVHTALGAGVRAHVTRGSVVQIGDHSFRVETP